jgi:hypothetical protein
MLSGCETGWSGWVEMWNEMIHNWRNPRFICSCETAAKYVKVAIFSQIRRLSSGCEIEWVSHPGHILQRLFSLRKIFLNFICSMPHNYISNTSMRQHEPLLFHTSMGLMSSLCHCAWNLQTTVAIWNDITACCNHFPQTAVSWGNWAKATYLVLWRLQDCHSFCRMVPNYNMYHCALVG